MLAWLVIGQQHLLAHTSLIPQHGLDQPAPDPGASMRRMNQDVLKVGDGDAVTPTIRAKPISSPADRAVATRSEPRMARTKASGSRV